MKLLIINPGSTSTKISVFDEYDEIFEESVFHDAPVLLQFPHVNGQVPFRKQVIIDILKKHGFEPTDIDVYVLFHCDKPSGVPRGPANSTVSINSQDTLGSSLRSPAEVDGNDFSRHNPRKTSRVPLQRVSRPSSPPVTREP